MPNAGLGGYAGHSQGSELFSPSLKDPFQFFLIDKSNDPWGTLLSLAPTFINFHSIQPRNTRGPLSKLILPP